jgi:hypothetical protein
MAQKKSPANKAAQASAAHKAMLMKFNEAMVGVADTALANVRINQIAGALWLPTGLNAAARKARTDEALHTIAELRPREEYERMLIGQLIACHHASIECYRRAMIEGQVFEVRDSNLKHAEKLSATYARLLETLDKHRGKGQQKVTVEHVHVAAGGQAIVGNVDSGTAASAPVGRRRVAPPQLEHQVSVPLSIPDAEVVEAEQDVKSKRD